jgi:hypothetical protein
MSYQPKNDEEKIVRGGRVWKKVEVEEESEV